VENPNKRNKLDGSKLQTNLKVITGTNTILSKSTCPKVRKVKIQARKKGNIVSLIIQELLRPSISRSNGV